MQEELRVPEDQPVFPKGTWELCREHARCWGLLRPRAVRWRKQPWKPVLVPHPQVPTIPGCVPQLPISFSLFKPSAIFPRAWGWHHLLIFLDVWQGAGGTRLSRILCTECAAPCRERLCVDEAHSGGKQRDATFKSELFTHFQLQVRADQGKDTNANFRGSAAGT